MSADPCPYVSRGGLKLAAALDAFSLDVTAMRCADLGCNVGGFTDCLLQRGADHVYAVDTSYGDLAWTLRQHERVTVVERTNALHFDPTSMESFAPVDLVVIDLGWTRQHRAIPAARRWLGDGGRIITLIKPQYETDAPKRGGKGRGILDQTQARAVHEQTLAAIAQMDGVAVMGDTISPIKGGGKRGKAGNVEYLALLEVKPGDGHPRALRDD